MKDERVADGRRGEEGKQSKKGGDEEREREGPFHLIILSSSSSHKKEIRKVIFWPFLQYRVSPTGYGM